MEEILKLAGDAGMSKEQAEKATGGIMSLVKSSLESGDYSKILQSIPEIESLVAKHEEETTSRAGGNDLMGSAMSMMNSFGGSGSGGAGGQNAAAGGASSITGLLALLQGQGIGLQQLNSFMPMLTNLLKGKSGVDVSSILGVASPQAGQQPAAQQQSGGFSAGNLLGGMFGK